MAISLLKDWNDGDILTEGDLEAEFNNIYNNALSLISPLTGNLNCGGNDLLNAGQVEATTFKPSGAAGATPTANVIYTDSIVKGWVKFQIDGTIEDDLNVASITDTGTGNWTVVWATDFATSSYCAIPGILHPSDGDFNAFVASQATGTTVVHTTNSTALADFDKIFCMAIGDQ